MCLCTFYGLRNEANLKWTNLEETGWNSIYNPKFQASNPTFMPVKNRYLCLWIHTCMLHRSDSAPEHKHMHENISTAPFVYCDYSSLCDSCKPFQTSRKWNRSTTPLIFSPKAPLRVSKEQDQQKKNPRENLRNPQKIMRNWENDDLVTRTLKLRWVPQIRKKYW